MVHGEVTQYTSLNLYFLRVGLPFHLITRLQLLLGHHTQTLEHLDTLSVKVTLENLRARLLHIQSTLGSLYDPLVAIAITVEADGLASLDILT